MKEPCAGTAGFRFSKSKPGGKGERDSYKYMLSQNAPCEGDDEPKKLIDRPEPDEFRIIEPPG